MVQPNYAFQKRQRDLAKKQKKEEKRLKKAAGHDETAAPEDPAATAPVPTMPDVDKPAP